jgi:hypothetical protein
LSKVDLLIKLLAPWQGGSGELYPLSYTPQPRFSSSPQASAIGGGEGGGAADEFRAKMRITRFRYLAPFFNK